MPGWRPDVRRGLRAQRALAVRLRRLRRPGPPAAEPSFDVSSECSGEPGSSPYTRWPVCTLATRAPPPAAALLKRLSTTRRGGGGGGGAGARDGKPGDGGRTLFSVNVFWFQVLLLGEVTREIAVNSQSCS